MNTPKKTTTSLRRTVLGTSIASLVTSVLLASSASAGDVYYDHTNFDLLTFEGGYFFLVNDNGSLTPNRLAVVDNLDRVLTEGPSGSGKLVKFFDSVGINSFFGVGLLDAVAPTELTSIFTLGVSLANVQSANLIRRMDDIHAGAGGFSSNGYAMNTGSGSHQGTAGPSGKSGKEIRPPAENRWGVFITGVGEWTDVGDTSNARGYNLKSGGFTLGVDYKVTPNFALGIYAGYVRSDARLTGGQFNDGDNDADEVIGHGHLRADGAKFGLYSTYYTGGFYADAAVGGGYNSYETRRRALGNSDATASPDGWEFNALFATGYDWKSGGLSVGPTASVQYTYVGLNSFNESGSLIPLRFKDQSAESLRTALGMKASYEIKTGGGVIIRPEVRVAWQHEFGEKSYELTSRFANGLGREFTVRGPEIEDDSMLIGAGLTVLWNERTSTYLFYDGEVLRQNYSSQNISGGVRLSF